MAYTQDQINAALQAELAARPGASYDAILQQAGTFGLDPAQVAAAYDALYPQSTINQALMDEVAARPGASYDQLFAAGQNYGVDANEFNKAWANMGFTNAGITDRNTDGVVDSGDVTAADVQKALQSELTARPGSNYGDLLTMADNVYGISPSTFNAGYDNYLQSAPAAPAANTGSAGGATPTLLSVSNGGRDWPGTGTSNSGGWNGRTVSGASNGNLMGAGNANYNSSLIRSLRQNSMTPISTNPGVQFAGSPGVEASGWQAPAGQGSAFNPQVFNPRAASPQEINDYNAYSAYRSSSVGASNPYLSLTDWIAQGRPTAVQNTNSTSGNQTGGGSSTVPGNEGP